MSQRTIPPLTGGSSPTAALRSLAISLQGLVDQGQANISLPGGYMELNFTSADFTYDGIANLSRYDYTIEGGVKSTIVPFAAAYDLHRNGLKLVNAGQNPGTQHEYWISGVYLVLYGDVTLEDDNYSLAYFTQ